MIHVLKTVQPFFDDVWKGKKDFEVRKNDRNFNLGDTLSLMEYNPVTGKYSGLEIRRHIKYILDDPQYVKEGYVILGME